MSDHQFSLYKHFLYQIIHYSNFVLLSRLDDPLPTPTPESVFLEDIQLPDEVAKFFHSKSFHPEDLENLKGILRRSQDHQRSMLADRFGQAGPPLTSDSKPTQRLRGEMMSENQESLSRQHALPEGLFPFERQTDTDALRRLFTSFEDMRQYFRSSHFLTSTYESAGRPTGVHAVKRGRKIGTYNLYIRQHKNRTTLIS